MRFGFHVSIAESIAKAPERAHALGAECFQMFSRSPRGGPAPELTEDLVGAFRTACTEHDLEAVVHTPYYINLASERPRVRHGSVTVIREELERASVLGARYVMAHIGSGKDVGRAKGVAMVIDGVREILDGYEGPTQFLIENAAGAGEILGDTFEEIATMIDGVERKGIAKGTVGVCFDTCHAFASDYDLSTAAGVMKVLKQFDATIGLDRLKLIHANDSKGELGDHKDRHEHIGHGNIGGAGFQALVTHPKLKEVNMVLETPHDGKHVDDLATLKRFREKE